MILSIFLHYVLNGVIFSVIEKPKLLLIIAISLNSCFIIFKIWMIKLYVSILIGILELIKDACFIAYLFAFYYYMQNPSLFLEIFSVCCFGLALLTNLIEIICSIVISIRDCCQHKKN